MGWTKHSINYELEYLASENDESSSSIDATLTFEISDREPPVECSDGPWIPEEGGEIRLTEIVDLKGNDISAFVYGHVAQLDLIEYCYNNLPGE